jgi:cytochrome b subunit of formate dehydrogenase
VFIGAAISFGYLVIDLCGLGYNANALTWLTQSFITFIDNLFILFPLATIAALCSALAFVVLCPLNSGGGWLTLNAIT